MGSSSSLLLPLLLLLLLRRGVLGRRGSSSNPGRSFDGCMLWFMLEGLVRVDASRMKASRACKNVARATAAGRMGCGARVGRGGGLGAREGR